MLNRITLGKILTKYLSTDNDPLFTFHQWRKSLRVLGIEEIKSVPHTPSSHPFIERLIGTVRRECLDQTLFWGEKDLERKPGEFTAYYNEHRVHYGFTDRMTPAERKLGKSLPGPIDIKNISYEKHCKGFFMTPKTA